MSMRLSWGLIIFFSFVVTVGFIAYQIADSIGGDEALVQYEVEELEDDLGVEVIDFVAKQYDEYVRIKSTDIGDV